MTLTSIVIIDAKSNLFTVRTALEQRYAIAVNHTEDVAAGLSLVRSSPPNYILVNPIGIEVEVIDFLTQLAHMGQSTPVIVVGDEEAAEKLRLVYPRVLGSVPSVYSERDLLPFLMPQRPSQASSRRKMALAERAALVQANQSLQRRVQEALTLYQIGKSVASLTDLDTILARIVEAAVFLLRAEESSIMLRDAATNELYLRSERGLGEKQARGFNLKVEDTLIGSVVRNRRPVRMARDARADEPLKVVTGYMVNALLYVPLTLRGQVIGVLGVANQTAARTFDKHDQRLLEALADYAALAIEVARQHKVIEQLQQGRELAHIITVAVEDIRRQMATDDPVIFDALDRIEGAADTLIRIAEEEAPTDV